MYIDKILKCKTHRIYIYIYKAYKVISGYDVCAVSIGVR